ncbi:Hypothetical_protein [Hexamita inflata]|uniref:Hypothetical_protein n=1 Tax=Hexamita inflata TaxID=28002 RepID=A0AA86RBU8_9EUKA|nr:Hypothetical protein HINF_LOCUS59413 [Hexamita inflata]
MIFTNLTTTANKDIQSLQNIVNTKIFQVNTYTKTQIDTIISSFNNQLTNSKSQISKCSKAGWISIKLVEKEDRSQCNQCANGCYPWCIKKYMVVSGCDAQGCRVIG